MSSLLRWPTVRLKELASKKKNAIVGGPFGSNLVTSDYQSEGIPVIRGVNLPMDDRFSCKNFVFVSERKGETLKQNLAAPNDLVFTQRGTLGQVGIIPIDTPYKKYLISQSQMKMTVNLEMADPNFLYYFFKMPSTIKYIENHALQSGVPHINLGILKNLEVIFPPLQVQKKIAGILTAYDDLIENNNRRVGLLEQMAEEIYREWFVRFRFPGWKEAEFNKGIPKSWEFRKIYDIASFRYGYTESALKDDSYPKFLRVMDINKGSFIPWRDVPNCPITENEYEKYELKVFDIVIARMADPGKVAIIENDIKAVFASYLIKINYNQALITPYYFFYYLKQDNLNQYFANANSGATRGSINAKLIGSTPVLMPPKALMRSFDEKVTPFRKQIQILSAQNSTLCDTKNQLLPRLISGKLSVENLDIQFPPSMQESEDQPTTA